MIDFGRRTRQGVSVLACILVVGLIAPLAVAQEEQVHEEIPEADGPEMKVSASLDVSLNSHFISYGLDVWGGGNGCCEDGTINPSAEVAFDIEGFSIFAGTWWDVNNNAPPSIGGELQEVDVWIGVGYSYENFSFGITYQEWIYAGGTENILDLSFGYDDTELWGDSGMVALNPSILFHKRMGASNIASPPGESENGWVIVLGIEPSFTVLDSETYPVTLSVPLSLGIFPEDGFHGTQASGAATDSGIGWFNLGVSVSVPLAFIPSEYGEWSAHGNITYWHTEDDVIANPDDDFLTYTLGVSLAF